MTIRFNTPLLAKDLDNARKRRKISWDRTATRTNVQASTLYSLQKGKIHDITVTTLARILDFIGTTDIEKYMYDDGE